MMVFVISMAMLMNYQTTVCNQQAAGLGQQSPLALAGLLPPVQATAIQPLELARCICTVTKQ